MEKKNNDYKPSGVFKVGAIALAFLILGYQTALFVHRATTLRIEAARDRPDTVYVIDSQLAGALLGVRECGTLQDPDYADRCLPPAGNSVAARGHLPASGGGGKVVVKRESAHSAGVQQVREATRKVENFRFNPNTVSVEDLQRLGFSRKQAEAIDAYRSKGGRFRRKEDFAKSFVVADSVYRRLKPWIDIPTVDINKADSAAFDALPGIGGWFASRMVSYRRELGGYSYPEQLMDIYHFDQEKYDGLKDLICCSKPHRAFRLWSLGADSLRLHPYIKSWQTAKAIVLYRENNDPEQLTVAGLAAAGVLTAEQASKLSRCSIEQPSAR